MKEDEESGANEEGEADGGFTGWRFTGEARKTAKEKTQT